jgi:hypothetical protein
VPIRVHVGADDHRLAHDPLDGKPPVVHLGVHVLDDDAAGRRDRRPAPARQPWTSRFADFLAI